MHQQIVEALKRLEVAKDHYVSAIRALDRQYLKPLDGAGIEAEAVAAIRGDYGVFPPFTDPPASDDVVDAPPAAKPSTKATSRKKK